MRIILSLIAAFGVLTVSAKEVDPLNGSVWSLVVCPEDYRYGLLGGGLNEDNTNGYIGWGADGSVIFTHSSKLQEPTPDVIDSSGGLIFGPTTFGYTGKYEVIDNYVRIRVEASTYWGVTAGEDVNLPFQITGNLLRMKTKDSEWIFRRFLPGDAPAPRS